MGKPERRRRDNEDLDEDADRRRLRAGEHLAEVRHGEAQPQPGHDQDDQNRKRYLRQQ